MDGDQADAARLGQIARRHDAFLYLDEAHATCVLGPRGMGLSGLHPGEVDLSMGTFSKGLGSFGAYVAGSRVLCDYLVNACGGFIERSEEHTSELQSLMRISYAVFCLKKKKQSLRNTETTTT